LTNPAALKQFFQQCGESDEGEEPGWNEHKQVILEGYKRKNGS
jgi:hypothetical protein